MSNINDYNKWKKLGQILYEFNNNDEEIVEIINIILELDFDSDNNFEKNYICKNHYKLCNIVDTIYNVFGDGICSNRAEYEFYRSLAGNIENNTYVINNKDSFEKFNKFRKYLELLNFVKSKYNQDIDLMSINLPKWFMLYIGLKI